MLFQETVLITVHTWAAEQGGGRGGKNCPPPLPPKVHIGDHFSPIWLMLVTERNEMKGTENETKATELGAWMVVEAEKVKVRVLPMRMTAVTSSKDDRVMSSENDSSNKQQG